jgi:hypothetical protein
VRQKLPFVVAFALVGVAVAVILVVTLSSRSQPSTTGSLPGKQPLSASWLLSPSSVLFGDTVHVRIDATVDRNRLDPDLLRLETNFKPYERLGPRRVSRSDVSHYTHLTYRWNLRCVITECAPDAGALQRFSFLPGKLLYSARPKDGKAAPSVPLDWPTIVVLSRIDPIDLQRRARGIGRGNRQINVQPLPPWRVDSQLLPVSYGVRPNTAFWLSVVGALLLIGAASFLLRSYLPAPAFLRRDRHEPLPLERAIAAVESARASGLEDRERKALELLGAELLRSGEIRLAESARALAWSQPDPPEPARTAALTVDVRRVIEDRSNGHAD